MEIEIIKIVGGYGRSGEKEPVGEVLLKMGDVASIVGPTGSGKTALINDIELFANENTPSRRKIFINDMLSSDDPPGDPSRNPIAMITQHTNFLSDLSVRSFLTTHAKETIGVASTLFTKPNLIFSLSSATCSNCPFANPLGFSHKNNRKIFVTNASDSDCGATCAIVGE